MKSLNTVLILVISFLFALSPIKSLAQVSDEYVVTTGREQLNFVRRPELGYVVVSKEEASAVEALDGTLRQFGARDIRAVRGLSRRGVSVVFSQRPASENENTIKTINAQSQIRYAAPLFSSNETVVAIIPEIVVRLREQTDNEQLQDLCQSINVKIKHKLQFTELEYLIEVLTADESGVFSAVEQLNEAVFVEWAVPNVAFQPQLLGQVEPNDTYFPNQWHLNNTGQSGGTPNADINAPEAWEITTGDPNIVVAVLDQGVDTDHPDLINNIVTGYDFYDDDSDPNPTGNDAHGTACSGLIAARGNNGIGVTGVTWNCKIMPIRIGEESGFITEEDIATAIRWAANNGANILSNSWGGDFSMPTIHSAIIDVTEPDGIGREGKGCVVLFASGNNQFISYPAIYDEVIAVGATDHDDVHWDYSGSGPELDIVAPSGNTNLIGNIWTTDIVGSAGYNNRDSNIIDYTDKMGGTSGACPVAAGVAALVLSIEPNLTNLDVRDIMQLSARDLGSTGHDDSYGYGRIDALTALNLTIEYSLFPRLRWISYYNRASDTDKANAIAVDDYGNVYVTGASEASYEEDYATVKYDSNGNELWVARYNGPGRSYDIARALAVDYLGNVCVTGYSTGTYSPEEDITTIKYDPNGTELWVGRYNGPADSDDGAYDIAIDELGYIYVTGKSNGIGTRSDYTTIKYDPNGNQLWVARYNGPANSYDYAHALAVDNSGNIYITGYSSSSINEYYDYYDYVTIKYDANGNQLWAASYDSPGSGPDTSYSLGLDNSGNVYVTGSSSSSSTSPYYDDYLTIKYDPNGNQLWTARYNGPANRWDEASELVLDSAGNIYVTGSSEGNGTYKDYATVKYDPNGNQLWVARYDGPAAGSDTADSIDVDSFDCIYVTGYSDGFGNDFATIKYDPNGNQLWVKRYNGLWNYGDYATDLAVDNFGNVYLTGHSYRGLPYDNVYATIKYTQHNYCTEVLDGDSDGNCKVDIDDIALFADEWLDPFDFTDYAMLADDWLNCNFALQEDCW